MKHRIATVLVIVLTAVIAFFAGFAAKNDAAAHSTTGGLPDYSNAGQELLSHHWCGPDAHKFIASDGDRVRCALKTNTYLATHDARR